MAEPQLKSIPSDTTQRHVHPTTQLFLCLALSPLTIDGSFLASSLRLDPTSKEGLNPGNDIVKLRFR